ncbi:hypothetical protein [Methanohalophilus sp.]|jgi:hypothetical protein
MKEDILIFIMESKKDVPEPAIRDHLENKKGKKLDISNIKRHLEALRKQNCLSKLSSPGKANRWKISNKNHLKNIHQKYTSVDLKQYQKTADIIDYEVSKPINDIYKKYDVKFNVKDTHYTLDSTSNKLGDFVKTIMKTESMFQAVIENDFDDLYLHWVALYAWEENPEKLKNGDYEPSPVGVIYHAYRHYLKHDIVTGKGWGGNVFFEKIVKEKIKK